MARSPPNRKQQLLTTRHCRRRKRLQLRRADCVRSTIEIWKEIRMMRRMLYALALLLVGGVSAGQAATVTSSFNFVGQSFGGQDVSVDIPLNSNVRPGSDGTLALSIRGDYDTMNELVTVSLDGTEIGQAGTTMSNAFLGENRVNNGIGDISFTRSFVISLADLTAAFDGDNMATLLFDRNMNVGASANAQISGTLTFSAVPEPSTFVLTSLGLVCVGCLYTWRRRSQSESCTAAI